MSKIRVTVTVEIDDGGETVQIIGSTKTETSGNPAFHGRVAHRLTEALSDEQRIMIGTKYGEVDKKWKQS